MSVEQGNEQHITSANQQDSLATSPELVLQENEKPWKRSLSWRPLLFLYQWFVTNTFSPVWLPRKLRRPAIGSAVAVLLQLLACLITFLVIHIFPGYAIMSLWEVLAIALVALTWGAGPSIIATFVGLILLNFSLTSSSILWDLDSTDDLVERVTFLLVGLSITIVASQVGKARQQAELLAISLESERNRLDAIIETVPDTVAIYDTQGKLVRLNRAGREAVGPEHDHASLEEIKNTYDLRTADEQPFPSANYPGFLALCGETVSSVEMHYTIPGGQSRSVLVSAAPLHDGEGNIEGVVSITHDISRLRQSERRTQETLNALLAMAEALVLPSDTTTTTGELTPESASKVAKRIAELICSVLDCQRVIITAIEPETGVMSPLAVIGLSPEQEHQWWDEQPRNMRLNDSPAPDLVEQLRSGEVLILDMTQPPFNEAPNPYNVHTMLTAPMSTGNSLVGLLSLDHGGEAHQYSNEEIALAKAIARLGALVIERERLLRERADARANELALREANRRMDDFLGMTSHELKTPLTSIKGNTQLAVRQLKNNLQSIQNMQSMMESTENQIKLLDRLVNDLLDISRTQESQLALNEKPCDLTAIVHEIIGEQQRIHPLRTITLHSNETALPIIADEDRITQVIINYLTNALKYSPDSTPIEILLRRQDAAAYFAVRDEGPGLNADEQQHIWERFHRAHGVEVSSSNFGSSAGLGLGLYISKTIIEQHGGHVGVESAPNEGSLFWFTLPLAENLFNAG